MAKPTRALICGLGASGLAAARLLRAEGARVLVVDERDTPALRERAGLVRALGGEVVLGASQAPAGEFDLAVASPGLDIDGAMLRGVHARGIPLVSELELGWNHFRGRTLAVTGSNGKSTVVKALAEILTLGGAAAVPCGNYGLPVTQAVLEHPQAAWLVIETSSFQLETCAAFRPDIALMVNLQPNHLDRHGSMAVYARLKARLFQHQRPGDAALVPGDWLARFQEWSDGAGTWRTFGTADDDDYAYRAGGVGGEGIEVSLAGTWLDNAVLGPNMAGLVGAAAAAGVPAEIIERGLRSLTPLPHRAQVVAERGGVRWVNDSKATNLAAMMASMRMQNRPIWLIAGGRAKETDFAAAAETLREWARGVLLIGEAAEAMRAAWGQVAPCWNCDTLEQAVREARAMARPGDCILLAPACTSYDQFASYVERGDAFTRLAADEETAQE